MQRWQAGVLLLFAAYFPAALWSVRSYEDPTPKGALVVQLLRPFPNEGGFAFRAASPLPVEWKRLHGAEPATVYENGRPLVFRDSNWLEVSTVGRGHFLIDGNVIMFSASDNSDPNSNGRRYWVVVP